jgi:hypothetical protein
VTYNEDSFAVGRPAFLFAAGRQASKGAGTLAQQGHQGRHAMLPAIQNGLVKHISNRHYSHATLFKLRKIHNIVIA